MGEPQMVAPRLAPTRGATTMDGLATSWHSSGTPCGCQVLHAKRDTVGEVSRDGERSDAGCVGARFIAHLDGCGPHFANSIKRWGTPEAVFSLAIHPLRRYTE